MKMIDFSSARRGLVVGAMLAGLFIGAFIPAVGKAAGPWHIELHFLAFALFGSVLTACLWRLHWYWHGIIIVVIPVVHEICEIWGHHHGLEVMDIIIDIGGGLTGVIAWYAMKKFTAKY